MRDPGRAVLRSERIAPISTPLALLAVVVLVVLNGFFVATEFALVSVRRTRMQQLAADGNRRAAAVLDRLDNLDTYIAATQLGITMASLGLGWLGEPAIARLIEPLFASLAFIPEATRNAAEHTVAFAVAFSIITTLHIVIGELAPKSLALQRPDQTSLATAGPIHLFLLLFKPVIHALNAVGNAVVRLVGVEPAAGHSLVQSADELRLAVDASRAAGLVEEAAQDLVDRAFLFTDLTARQVMVPRTTMTAVPLDAGLDGILETATESGHSRLPVYAGDIDHIVGVVNVNRLLPRLRAERLALARGETLPLFDIREVMGEVLAVPELAPAVNLLERLRDTHTPLAIVIDEFGGTAGLVTLVDLVESLVGEIDDEQDPIAPATPAAIDGSFGLDGMTTLVEAREFHDLNLEDDEYDVETVGGYVFSRLGRPAAIGDEVETPDGQTLRVEELNGLRIARLRVLPRRQPEADVTATVEAMGAA
ncbi:MAG: Magnesium and cobalt efflux protein CorC [uncultured Thermomicrobiales bacterium]|uniref:Magnesium and cobalt efflux protein CorC n=1 Tax=uncultured Thermomicrobiales bacterium TaxID=1645740 RepID=A0A6J4TZB7_9BACT|nr:MAG: Magnesium and cobalt efflux protein CorC [uncultured Thermomicrobiales bacterium]